MVVEGALEGEMDDHLGYALTGIAVTPDSGLSATLTRTAAAARASELILLAKPFTAQQVLDWRAGEPHRPGRRAQRPSEFHGHRPGQRTAISLCTHLWMTCVKPAPACAQPWESWGESRHEQTGMTPFTCENIILSLCTQKN